jgi:hypothetical protein
MVRLIAAGRCACSPRRHFREFIPFGVEAMLSRRASDKYQCLVLALSTIELSVVAIANERVSDVYTLSEKREPCAHYNPLRAAHFGDLHVHTTLSLDAVKQGTITGPGDAYRYARGESISIPPYGEEGEVLSRAQISRPLDFADGGMDVANLHRNVMFRNAEVPTLPSSFIESPDAPALWQHLELECSEAKVPAKR